MRNFFERQHQLLINVTQRQNLCGEKGKEKEQRTCEKGLWVVCIKAAELFCGGVCSFNAFRAMGTRSYVSSSSKLLPSFSYLCKNEQSSSSNAYVQILNRIIYIYLDGTTYIYIFLLSFSFNKLIFGVNKKKIKLIVILKRYTYLFFFFFFKVNR